jgi:putative redox protein
MEAEIKLLDGVCFVGTAGSGHSVVIDGPPDHGGQNRGIRPMELLLLGLAGCAAFDVVHILRKGRHDVEDCHARVVAERAEEDPKVFTRIHLHFIVRGAGVNEKHLARAVKLSADKYCSASIMLGKMAEITHSYELSGNA